MSEYVLADLVRTKFTVSDEEVSRFERRGILHPVHKNNLTYYSSKDCYRLKAVLHFMRDEGLSLDLAQEKISPARSGPKSLPGNVGAELAAHR